MSSQGQRVTQAALLFITITCEDWNVLSSGQQNVEVLI